MSNSESIFASVVQKANLWVKDLDGALGIHDEAASYQMMKSVLHTLRDQLTTENCGHLAAQLPQLIRGAFYEGWRPGGHKPHCHSKDAFYRDLQAHYHGAPLVDPETMTRCVFWLLYMHLGEAEVEKLKLILPQPLGDLWPQSPAKLAGVWSKA